MASNVIHAAPRGDLIEHDCESFGACVCGPTVEALVVGMATESGYVKRHVGWTVIHHSLDGRELQEA